MDILYTVQEFMPNFHSILNKNGQDFLDIQYSIVAYFINLFLLSFQRSNGFRKLDPVFYTITSCTGSDSSEAYDRYNDNQDVSKL